MQPVIYPDAVPVELQHRVTVAIADDLSVRVHDCVAELDAVRLAVANANGDAVAERYFDGESIDLIDKVSVAECDGYFDSLSNADQLPVSVS
jgi:hypothetical protein